MVISRSMPRSAVAGTASSTPALNDPVSCTKVEARNAPTMYSEPCARLIMSMMPNTSVRPAASRNSISPNCRPFSDCSRIRIQDNGGLLRIAGFSRASPEHLPGEPGSDARDAVGAFRDADPAVERLAEVRDAFVEIDVPLLHAPDHLLEVVDGGGRAGAAAHLAAQ